MPVATKHFVMELKKKKQIASTSIQTAQTPTAQPIVWSYFRKKKAKRQQKS